VVRFAAGAKHVGDLRHRSMTSSSVAGFKQPAVEQGRGFITNTDYRDAPRRPATPRDAFDVDRNRVQGCPRELGRRDRAGFLDGRQHGRATEPRAHVAGGGRRRRADIFYHVVPT